MARQYGNGLPLPSAALADGTAVVVDGQGLPLPAVVWVDPASGDTVRVRYRLDPNASWQVWPNGSVTAYSEMLLASDVCDLEFQRTAGSGTTSKYGVA
jgi:hypothetical protein